jgi:hypothetical protein
MPTTKQLQKIDAELEIPVKKDEILIRKRGYFLYYNEPNKKRKEVKIHIHTCGFCAWGSGNGRNPIQAGRNGVWIGPFSKKIQAETFSKNILGLDNVTSHTCC